MHLYMYIYVCVYMFVYVSIYVHVCAGIYVCMLSACKSFSSGGDPLGVVAKALDIDILESEFKITSRYYIHFRTNTLGEDMSPLFGPLAQKWLK